jgi:ATP-dependent helicase/nuclease subunit A
MISERQRALAAARVQQRASDAGASVFVAASAGTGKTKVLTDRVLALMLRGSDPARILCLTFTKAAAAEMANRLHDRLSLWATVADGKLAQELQALTDRAPDDDAMARARRLFARVLDTPGGMKIETIHAFCQSLLRRFPLEAGIAPHFELMDERNAADALGMARDEMLSLARGGRDDRLEAALREVTARIAESTFDELMAELIRDRARFAHALAAGEAALAERLARLLGIAVGTTAEAVVATACAAGAAAEASLAEAARAMLASASKRDQERGAVVTRWLDQVAARVAHCDEYLSVFFTKEGSERKDILTKAVAAGAPQAEAALRCEAARLAQVLRRRDAAALMQATGALATLGGALLALYERHKSERARLDYDDLVLRARDLLRRPGVAPWVLFKLDGGLDHILIDEAQDTNPEQWQVVQSLADEFFAGMGARAPGRTVFAVGDAKQSIFSFQRADPVDFLRMREHFAKRVQDAQEEWRTVDLDISFRSTAAVLAAVDAVFARASAASGVALDGAPIRHMPYRAGAGGLVELWPPVEPVDPPRPEPWEPPIAQRQARAPQARLARAIARTLRRWLDAGERLPARDRPLSAGDVLVLVRRRGPFVVELVRALKRENVAVAGADRMMLTEQLAVQDLLALAQFLLLPEDDLTLATVLKGPICGLDEEQLFRLAHGRRGRLWPELRARAGEHPAFARAAELLGDLLGRVDFMPPYELFAEVLGARGGRRLMLGRLGAEAADPLDELLAAALVYERSHGPSLQGFLHWLVAGDHEVKRDLDQRGRDEVRIMTVHGAKGLEAPIVFLPDTMQVPRQVPSVLWTAAGLPLWRINDAATVPPLDQARAAAMARRDEEYRRLLYVALTRAEDRLYICGWRTRQKQPDDCWYDLVKEGLRTAPGCTAFAFDAAPLIGSDGWAGEGLRLESPQRGRARAEDRFQSLKYATELPLWATRPPPPEPSPPKPLAPSQPREAEPAVRSPLSGDEGAGFRRGRLVHRLLQSLPLLPPEARAGAARRFLKLPLHGLDPAAQEALARETLAVLEDEKFAPLFAPGSEAEVPVVGLIEGRALSGRIDRLAVTAESVLIVDYKTLRPVPQSAAEVPALYLDQLRSYRGALEAVYPGRRIRCALLWTDGPKLMEIPDAILSSH